MGTSGPRMPEITSRYADCWWPGGDYSPEDCAAKLKVIRDSAERTGRDSDGYHAGLHLGLFYRQ